MENHVHSALICASRLIRLAGLNPMDIETFSQKVAIDTSVKTTLASLQRYIVQFSQTASVRFKIRKQALEKIRQEQLPLAFRDRQGNFILLARMNEQQVLLQYADDKNHKC